MFSASRAHGFVLITEHCLIDNPRPRLVGGCSIACVALLLSVELCTSLFDAGYAPGVLCLYSTCLHVRIIGSDRCTKWLSGFSLWFHRVF